MKKIVLIFIVLVSFVGAEPIHHKINNWFHDNGYIDRWSWSHAQTGTIKGILSDIGQGYATRHGYDYPSAFELMGYNLWAALVWELYEYGESGMNFADYDKAYNGHALENNGMDVFLDMLAFSVPLWDDLYYELKILKHEGFTLQLTWSF